jgi:hypothetical protein
MLERRGKLLAEHEL